MNKLIKIISVYLLIIALSGCYGELEPINYGEISPSIFPQTEKDMEALVMSCYQPVLSLQDASEYGYLQNNDLVAGIFTARNMWTTAEIRYTENSATTTRNWTNFILRISRCTIVRDQVENSELLSDAKKKKLMAEVSCARAYMSYTLFDMYGPLVVAPLEVLQNPMEEKPLPRLSEAEMVKFIEDDLLYAAENLPHPRDAEYGKFTSGFAKMMLIRLYLHQTVNDKNNYAKVETLARELMGSGYEYELMPDYPNMFRPEGQGSSNKEFIFVVPSSYDGASANSWHMMSTPSNMVNPPMLVGWISICGTWWFFDSFEEGDTRKTFLLDEYTTTEGVLRNRENPGGVMELGVGPLVLKYDWDMQENNYGGRMKADRPIYRYADVILSLAEAIVMKPGGSVTPEAIELVNTIRRRAHLQDVFTSNTPTAEVFIDQLLFERAHEYWCENGQYRADLIRHDKLYDRWYEIYPNLDPAVAARYKILFPLPPAAITDGQGLVIQNPGYSL